MANMLPRIISGKFRGQTLSVVSGTTRPITGRIKQSLFDTIREFIPNALVLDCFAGSGSMGLEALSRGATKVIFVEKDEKAAEILKKNILKMHAELETEVINKDAMTYLVGAEDKFDLLFADPPFPIAKLIKPDNFVKVMQPEALLVFRAPSVNEKPAVEQLTLVHEEYFGESTIYFYRQAAI